ncbi:MAG: cytidine deaminase [Bacteroidota bacterium]
MKQEIKIHYELFDQASLLAEDEAALLDAALKATENAYAPFSNFLVGCAIQLADGEIITGNNQENLAFPSGICAERTALFYAGSLGKGNQVIKLAVRARTEHKAIDVPVMPCGACRQVMVEYENLTAQPMIILSQGIEGQIMRLEGVKQTLLPLSFDIEF